jgi:hypothetical protein
MPYTPTFVIVSRKKKKRVTCTLKFKIKLQLFPESFKETLDFKEFQGLFLGLGESRKAVFLLLAIFFSKMLILAIFFKNSFSYRQKFHPI